MQVFAAYKAESGRAVKCRKARVPPLTPGRQGPRLRPVMQPRDPGAPANEPIYRAILWVMVVSAVAGVALALAGELVFASEAMKTAGTGTGIVSILIYFAFRWLGKRQASRRRARDGAAEGSERESDR